MTENPRWRRIDLAYSRVVDGGPDSPDDLVFLLSAIYDVWDPWSKALGKIPEQDSAVAGNIAGETLAALMHARGASTHDLVEWMRPRGYGEGPYGAGPYGMGWLWVSHHCSSLAFAQRDQWLAQHVSGRFLMDPLPAAIDWLRQR